MKTPLDTDEIPDKNFKRLLKAMEDCPKTAKELEEKSKIEEKQKTKNRKPIGLAK